MTDGTIRTDRVLYKSKQDHYVMRVVAKDGGLPPLNATTDVTIRVVDSNDNKPIIDFPTPNNNSVTIRSDLKPGEVVTEVVARDEDEGMNARLKYYIAGGNEAQVGEGWGLGDGGGVGVGGLLVGWLLNVPATC